MDIEFNRCCGETPVVLWDEERYRVYLKCPKCGRKSDRISVLDRFVGQLHLDRDSAKECAKRWNGEE